MTKEEAINAYIKNIKEIAEDSLLTINRIQETESSTILFLSSEELSEQAHDLFRLAVRIQTLENIDNLTTE